jgi:lipopolysaccharide/colanic/teichoic acid biosynthesis glycosyltransferase
MPTSAERQRYLWLKRALDVSIASVMLFVLAPFTVLAALIVRLTMGSPVLFRQRRPGKHGRPFTLLKLRTMDTDGVGVPQVGRRLRAASLDEVPQLINVIRGEMSLVGPRPLLMEYLPHYTPEQARRHDVLPGITGWAQVNGRNALTWEEQFARDVWYVEHVSFSLDVRILVRTLARVLTRHPAEVNSAASRAPFVSGSNGGRA